MIENDYDTFLKQLKSGIEQIKKTAKLKKFQTNAEYMEKLTAFVQEFFYSSNRDKIVSCVVHGVLNKISNMLIANDTKDIQLITDYANVSISFVNIIGFLLCAWDLNINSLNIIMKQYSITITKTDWFINNTVSQFLICGYIIVNLRSSQITLHKKEIIFDNIYRNVAEDAFFKAIIDEFSEFYRIKSYFEQNTDQYGCAGNRLILRSEHKE